MVGGFIVGLTSVGSGTLFALAMLLLFSLAAKYVVGTDIAHAAALLFVAGLGHLVAGNVDLPAMAWLLVGSIPGVLIGSQVASGCRRPLSASPSPRCSPLSGLKLLDVPYAERAGDRLARRGPGGAGRLGDRPGRAAHQGCAEGVAAYAGVAVT